jgi:catechol 2,3-dioxygenase-like lactoylglutathione lyase family enzyme
MDIGWHDICLKTNNMQATKEFYQALGMEVTHDSKGWVHLTSGGINISLMGFLSENWLNFRGEILKPFEPGYWNLALRRQARLKPILRTEALELIGNPGTPKETSYTSTQPRAKRQKRWKSTCC